MEEIFERFPNKETFDRYWQENYIPLTYEDVKAEYEAFAASVENRIFLSDYEENGKLSREDFMENLSQTAEFTFQDTLTEAFYEKNPQLYETAFALYEEAQLAGKDVHVADAFHEEYQRLYREFLLRLFDDRFAKRN